MALKKVLVVIGSGPGIGVSTASLLAARKFEKVALIARNSKRLVQDREAVLAAARKHGKEVDIATWSCDITDTPRFEEVLRAVETLGTVSCVLYNAAEVVPSELFKFPEEDIIRHFKVRFHLTTIVRAALIIEIKQITSIALSTAARWAMPLLSQEPDNPSLLVTSGLLHDDPIPQLFSLSMAKAAQRTLVLALQKAYPDIHIALLYIDGPVSPEETKNNPENIAESFWKLYSQDREHWTGEMVV